MRLVKAILDKNFYRNEKAKKITHKQLCEAAGISEYAFSRWFGGQSTSWPFNDAQWRDIITALVKVGLIELRATDESFPEYDGISSFFDQEEGAFEKLKKLFNYTYIGYRYSNSDPGKILQGFLVIKFNEEKKIITTEEFYRAKTGSWRRKGYMFMRPDGNIMILSRKKISCEPQFQFLFTVLHDEKTGKITDIDGLLVDFQSKILYRTPVYFKLSYLSTQHRMEEEATSLNENDVDDVIRKRLKNRMQWKVKNALMYFSEPQNEKTRKKTKRI